MIARGQTIAPQVNLRVRFWQESSYGRLLEMRGEISPYSVPAGNPPRNQGLASCRSGLGILE